jgi:hypothetical protein
MIYLLIDVIVHGLPRMTSSTLFYHLYTHSEIALVHRVIVILN